MPHPASRTAPADPAAHAMNRHDRPPGGATALPGARTSPTPLPAAAGSCHRRAPPASCATATRCTWARNGFRKIIGQALAAGSFVVCHDTLTYGDYPDYGPAICRGFFEAYCSRSPALILLRAYRRLVEVPARPESAPPRANPAAGH